MVEMKEEIHLLIIDGRLLIAVIGGEHWLISHVESRVTGHLGSQTLLPLLSQHGSPLVVLGLLLVDDRGVVGDLLDLVEAHTVRLPRKLLLDGQALRPDLGRLLPPNQGEEPLFSLTPLTQIHTEGRSCNEPSFASEES